MDFIKRLNCLKGKGITLVEIVIVVAIMLLLVAAAIGAINPINLTGRGYDAQRKKDIRRIKLAFEEYFSDKGYYPQAGLVLQMMDPENCNSDIFAPWLPLWPCDPKGYPYLVAVEESTAPKWYKIMTKLENRSDPDIPSNWNFTDGGFTIGDGSYNSTQANYGVSSDNVDWSEYTTLKKCQDACYYRPAGPGTCQPVNRCTGPNCYGDHNCSDECQTIKCPN